VLELAADGQLIALIHPTGRETSFPNSRLVIRLPLWPCQLGSSMLFNSSAAILRVEGTKLTRKSFSDSPGTPVNPIPLISAAVSPLFPDLLVELTSQIMMAGEGC